MASIRGYSKPLQEPDDELDVDITHEPVRVGGAMRRYRLHVGTLPPSTGDVLMPPGEEARDGLALALQRLVDKAERVEVDTAVP